MNFRFRNQIFQNTEYLSLKPLTIKRYEIVDGDGKRDQIV